MAWQPQDNFDNNLNDYDLNAIASQTSGDTGLGGTGLVTMQWLTEDDPTMSFANGQYPTFGNEHLAPDNWAPPPHPAHQAEMAGSLNGVGGLFDSQPPGDTAYASVDAFAVAAEGGRDAPAHALTDANATVDGQPPSQRRPRARPPSPQEWEQHKIAIHSFYMEQELTLRTTMQLMQIHHQFQASEKMYKDKFKQWNWSKNLPRAMAGRMLDVGNQRLPKRTYFLRNDRKWSMEEIQKRHSRRSAQGDSSLQEDSSIPDDFTYGTPPSSGITDTESVPENSHGADGDLKMADAATADTTEDLCKFLVEGRCRTNSTPEELYSRAREAVKAAEAGTCNHEEAESALRDAFSYFRHHFSPTHSKTVEIGYFMVSFYVKIGRVNDAHCILDWMTREHCGDAKSYNDGTVTYVLSTIAILRRTGRDKEANLLTIRLLEYRQTSKADHFLLRNCCSPCVGSNEMIENLLASSEHEKLEAMSKILERLSTDSNNHMFLQDLLPRYIQKCGQLTLEKQAIHSRCIFAAVLAKNASFGKALDTLKEAEQLLDMFLKKNIGSQRPLELSTLKLARRLAFTFGDANDPDACVRVLNTLLKHMNLDKDKDVHNGYGPLVCDFLKSMASQLHKKGFCEQSRAWINQAFITSQDLFGDNHECTKRIERVMLTCDCETFFDE